MKIEINRLLEGAKQAKGLAVVIDVIRAGTTISTLLSKGVSKIIVTGELDDALALKKNNPDLIVMGEKDAIKPEWFDYGNSPTELQDVDLKDKIVILSTSNGTKGIVNAQNADEIIIGSFVNFDAVYNYINKINPGILSLLPLGSSNINAPEDEIFAEYLKAKLENMDYDISNLKEKVGCSRSVRLANLAGFGKDIDLCLKQNLYNIVPKVYKEGDILVVKNAS